MCEKDVYRWRVECMKRLLWVSVDPSPLAGIGVRVRLDRIVYTGDVAAAAAGFDDDGIR